MTRRRAQGFTLIEIMVVITIIAALVSGVAVLVPKMKELSNQNTCSNNLRQLGGMFLLKAQENPSKARRYSGVALWLSYRKNADDIRRGDEKALICPGDQGVALPINDDDRKRWDAVDLDNPADDLCSFAARDFRNHPMSVESKERQIIGCDRQGPDGMTMHHAGVIICFFDGGNIEKVTREELGVDRDSPIVIGPESPTPMLQRVVYIARKGRD